MGNYEGTVVYFKGDYATPALLRKSVSGVPYRRAADPPTAMLSNWEHVCSATYAMNTNWSTFSRPLAFGGAKQEIHLPLLDVSQCPGSIQSAMIIFQPTAGGIAGMVFGKQEIINAVKASGMWGTALDVEM